MGAVNGNGRSDPSGSGQVDLKSATVKAAIETCLPIADGSVGANLEPVGVTRTAPKREPPRRVGYRAQQRAAGLRFGEHPLHA